MSSSALIGIVMKDLRGYMRPEEVERVISHGARFRDKVIMRVLWCTGCRVGELLLLRFEDVSWRDRLMQLWTLKRRKPTQRVISVDEKSLAMLQEYCYKLHIRKGHIFDLTERRVEQIVYEAGCAAGISKVGSKKIHPHHFRHSHAVAWIRANPTMEGLRKLQLRLGHANINSTIHYLQFATEEQTAEVETVFGKW